MLKLYICSAAVHSLARGSAAEMALVNFFSKFQMLVYNIYISNTFGNSLRNLELGVE